DNIVGGSWGLAIIGLTVVIRAALVPLTFRQLKSMQEMQRLAPQINALKTKYKDDKQRQQQEIMKFYQENKINPLASCLPLLLQLPVFISLFYMLRTDLKKHICGEQMISHYNALPLPTRAAEKALHAANFAHLPSKYVASTGCETVAPHSAKFLFIPDITARATGVVLVVLLLLYVGSQLASTMMMSVTADKTQRRMMMALPLVFTLFILSFPAGLLVYWITTNLWTMGQQYVIRRRAGMPTTAAAAARSGPPGGGGSNPPPAPRNGGSRGAGGAGGPKGGRGSPNGKPGAGGSGAPEDEPVLAAVSGEAPPPPPRKKKKRSGRRR
ncbi:MAG TPA: YidC/Oxa1 family membrane protein insertase, partial [Solirubrobacteraceae bacterium]|nr:YidC/Oxa1 family membrane protein insertase [Solirubrobacteraceae bacterium]